MATEANKYSIDLVMPVVYRQLVGPERNQP